MVRYVAERHIVIDQNPTPVPFWTPGRELENKTVIIIGGGPSHRDLDLDFIKDFNFIAVNSSCRKVYPIAKSDDILYFSDNSWNERFPELADKWPGKVICSNRNVKARLKDKVLRLDIQNLTEYMMIKSDYVQASSGHVATCLACWLGAKRIILIGFECDDTATETHGHKDYNQSDISAFKERFLPGWDGLFKRFLELGIEVINSTPDSKIRNLPFLDLKSALELK